MTDACLCIRLRPLQPAGGADGRGLRSAGGGAQAAVGRALVTVQRAAPAGPGPRCHCRLPRSLLCRVVKEQAERDKDAANRHAGNMRLGRLRSGPLTGPRVELTPNCWRRTPPPQRWSAAWPLAAHIRISHRLGRGRLTRSLQAKHCTRPLRPPRGGSQAAAAAAHVEAVHYPCIIGGISALRPRAWLQSGGPWERRGLPERSHSCPGSSLRLGWPAWLALPHRLRSLKRCTAANRASRLLGARRSAAPPPAAATRRRLRPWPPTWPACASRPSSRWEPSGWMCRWGAA